MSYCDFQVGDHVVCVDDANQMLDRPSVTAGCVYVVRGIFPAWSGTNTYAEGDPILTLEGLLHLTSDGRETGFRATRFRKVQKRNSGLSIEAFLTIKPGGFEEPRRERDPKKERVS